MRKLDKPTENPKIVFETCISRVKDPALKRKLESVSDNIKEAAEKYDAAGASKEFFKLHEHHNVAGIVTQKEMEKIYTDRMVNSKAPGRKYYDNLRASPPQGICPLCGQRPVSTLDHYLPKTKFPSLSVVLYNLVPACSECNKTKSDKIPKKAEDQTIHPYYDDLERDQWLFANVEHTSPVSIVFFANPPEDMDEILSERIKEHFKVFQLGLLYASQAAVELSNIRYRLNNIWEKRGAIQVKEHLLEEYSSRKAVHVNSWQTAMYQAIANCEWFCNGGFNN